MDKNEEIGGDEKNKDIPEDMMSAINFTLKEFLEIFHNTKWWKGEMLEGHLNRNSMTIYKE